MARLGRLKKEALRIHSRNAQTFATSKCVGDSPVITKNTIAKTDFHRLLFMHFKNSKFTLRRPYTSTPLIQKVDKQFSLHILLLDQRYTGW